MTEQKKPTCKTCPRWVQEVSSLEDAQILIDRERGECRARSPEIGMMGAAWPITHRDDWCDEHPARCGEPHCCNCGKYIGPRHYKSRGKGEPLCSSCWERLFAKARRGGLQ
jgi:hypothetical protein